MIVLKLENTIFKVTRVTIISTVKNSIVYRVQNIQERLKINKIKFDMIIAMQM